ncbi:MAG: trigger factor [Desulfuromonadales bacterium]|nr:trigger factor [Desulfuromonadales bacterium]
MQVQVETLSPVTKKISFEIPVDQVNSEIAKAYQGIQRRAKIQGFRPGKAPLQLIKRSYSDSMRDEVMRRFYEKTLYSTLIEHKIEPVDAPTIESDILEENSSFKYSALVEVMPEIDLKDYTGLEITRERYTFEPQKIEDEIARMRENMAQLVPVDDDSTVEKGHTVTIDYSFSVEGCPEETSNAENAMVEVGAYSLMPDFEDQLVGMKCGESKQVSVTLPEGYRTPAAAGKEGVFQVALKEIKRKELPELNDEFAQQFGDFETVEQLREKMIEYHQKHELDRIEHEQRESIIKALIEKNPIEVPQSMVKRQVDQMLENLKNRLKGRKMSIEMMGMDDDGFRERFHEAATDKVRGGLLLMSLIDKENFVVNDEEIEQRYEQIAAGNKEMLERIKEHYSTNRSAQNSMIAEIKEDKAIRFLLDNAVITETEPKAPEA